MFGSLYKLSVVELKFLKQYLEKNLRLRPEKCRFHQEEVDFLGHIVGRNGIRIDPRKIAVVKEWPRPTNVTEVQLFLGFTNFNRQFIQNYSAIAEFITWLIKKGQPFYWNKKQKKVSLTLKKSCAELTVF